MTLRGTGDELAIFLDEEPTSVAELRARWTELPPPAVVLRAEDSALGRVVALAHEVGVEVIELAYDLQREPAP